MLSNGDIVVVGAMRRDFDTLSSPGVNIGLVKYNPKGVRKQWDASGTDPAYFFNNEYVVYSDPSLTAVSVDGVAYADGLIVVLATRQFSAADQRNANTQGLFITARIRDIVFEDGFEEPAELTLSFHQPAFDAEPVASRSFSLRCHCVALASWPLPGSRACHAV